MDLIMIPQALMVLYGGLVLGCGVALGFIAGRNAKRRLGQPEPPELLRRVSILEDELDATRDELNRLVSEQDFMRRLREPRRQDEDRRDPSQSSAA